MELPEALAAFEARLKEENKSQGTIDKYMAILDRFAHGIASSRDLETLTILDIKAYRDAISIKRNPDNVIAQKTSASFRALHLSAIKSFLTFARNKLKIKPIDMNELDDLRPKKIKQKNPGYLHTEQIVALKDAAKQGDPSKQRTGIKAIDEKTRQRSKFKKLRDHAVISFLYNSGLRAAELLSIDEACLDEHDIKDPDGNIVRTLFLTVTGKGSKTRTIPLNDAAKEDLLDYLEKRKKDWARKCKRMKYERNKAGLPPMPDLVIPDEFFPFSYRTLHRLVQQAGKLAGIKKHTHPHLLRHTFATTLTTSKVDLNAIRKLLGHADIKTTTRYADSTDPVLVEAVNQLPHG